MLTLSNEDLLKSALESGSVKVKSVKNIKDLKIKSPKDSGLIDFDEIKKYRERTRRSDDDLDNWTGPDFVIFLRENYVSRMGHNWDLNWAPACTEVLRVKDVLTELFGFCDNVVLRDYITFFFKYYFDTYMRSNKEFYISFLRHRNVYEDFYKSYNYRMSIKTPDSKSSKNRTDISNVSIEGAFLLSDRQFLHHCGIVLATNWMIYKKDSAQGKAVNYVLRACLKLHRAKQLKQVVSMTECLSPYPVWFPFQGPNEILRKIASGLHMDIEFQDMKKSSFDFLRS